MLAVTGSKHGSTYIYDLLRICVPFFLFRANFFWTWVRERVWVSISCISTINFLQKRQSRADS